MRKCFLIFLFLMSLVGFFGARKSSAADIIIEPFSDIPIRNDFLLEPAKFEIFLSPGESTLKNVYVTNRLGRAMSFTVSSEDFTGLDNTHEGAVLTGKTSSRGVVTIPKESFLLLHGERAKIPVTISIPKNQKPGEVFIAMVISSGSSGAEKQTGTHIVGRAGALFFIRINGTVTSKGQLKGFHFHQKTFELLFQNDGDVHLNPYGVIEIRNMFNTTIATIPIDPWFVMPGFSRIREIALVRGLWGGRYTAVAMLNRGYENQIDTALLNFWIMPRVFGFVGAFVVGGAILFLIRKLLLR